MFGSRRSIRLLSVAGIRIGVDGSWFLMLFILIFLLSDSFRNTLAGPGGSGSSTAGYLTAVLTAGLFFVSLIIHELGHAFAARHHGIGVERIELFLFGGMTYMDREASSPGEELQIAAAGPLGTLLMVVIFTIVDLVIVGPNRLLHAAVLDDTITITPILLSLSWLLVMNVFIFVFNLIPAYPLDGGRIARALIWKATGDPLRGTAAAAQIGRGFAIIMALAGLWFAFEGSTFSGVWLLLLAWMLYTSATTARRSALLRGRVRKVQVADVMDSNPPVLPATLAATTAVADYFDRHDAPWLPVIDGDGQFSGIVRRYRIEQLADRDPQARVIDALETDQADRLRVLTDRPLTEVLAIESLRQMGALVAVDAANVVRGMISAAEVQRAIQSVLNGASI